MAITNHERIGKALDIMRTGLSQYIEREIKAVYGGRWMQVCKESMPSEWKDEKKNDELHLDAHLILTTMWKQWNQVFRNTLGQSERSYVSELRDVRNKWAHQKPFTYEDTYRALDTIQRLLIAVSASEEAEQVNNMAQETMRVRFDEIRRNQTRKKAAAAIEGTPKEGLKPWREVVTPHPDVQKGKYEQAEFAANLDQVYSGKAQSEYGDAREFFRRTYLTDGLRTLLKGAVNRLTGKGGDPIVQLQTNFGGGKTHSMIGLYHLFSGVPANELAGVHELLHEIGEEKAVKANTAVLVGFALNPGQPHTKPDGTVIRTLWGELAWQLAGKETYALVAENDQNGTSPDSHLLAELFSKHSPCLILIDEWVAYMRQTYQKSELSGGSFDSNLTFAQAITEAARTTDCSLLVATLPASDKEAGGEGGKEALVTLKHTFGRMETTWRPASAVESYEIVRRRLFEPITDTKDFAARDAVIRAFSDMYRKAGGDVPSECGELAYKVKMEKAYPIHPELFSRLYEDWGSLERFQRTRGVLRLMASVIAELWDRSDTGLLIMPSSIPMDAPSVESEMTRNLEDNWRPIIEKDIDGPDALPLKLDRQVPNLGRYSATRRAARTIFLGSAPLAHGEHVGLDDSRVKLGCVQPGETVATFGDAFRRLSDESTFLYTDGRKYWYSTQPSVTKLAQDRASQLEEDAVYEEIRKKLRAEKNRGDFSCVHAVPETSADIQDVMEARLVVLDPKYPHSARISDSKALITAKEFLETRGNSPRLYRNTLVFIATDKARLDDLKQAVRQFLAWDSINKHKDELNLDHFQSTQTKNKLEQAGTTVSQRINETFAWLLVPSQSDASRPIEWNETRLQGQEPLTVRASKKLAVQEGLITEYSAARVRMALDKYLWTDVPHISMKKLWEYYATYPYLSRLRDSQVLLSAVQDGIKSSDLENNFAYAERYDEEKKRYINLKAGEICLVIIDSESVLVKPNVAKRQIEEEQETISKTPEVIHTGDTKNGPLVHEKTEKLTRRFHGSIKLSEKRIGRDAGRIAEEVIQHLSTLPGVKFNIALEIQAFVPGNIPDNVINIITENCNTLRFDQYGFEEE